MRIKKQQLEVDMEQQTGAKSAKEYVKAVYCHPAYLTYIYSSTQEIFLIPAGGGWDEAQAGIKIAGRNINSLASDKQMIPPLWHKAKN